MSVARVIELSATSAMSFEDPLKEGVARSSKTLRNVQRAWVKEQEVMIEDGQLTGYKVNMQVTFVLDDESGTDENKDLIDEP